MQLFAFQLILDLTEFSHFLLQKRSSGGARGGCGSMGGSHLLAWAFYYNIWCLHLLAITSTHQKLSQSICNALRSLSPSSPFASLLLATETRGFPQTQPWGSVTLWPLLSRLIRAPIHSSIKVFFSLTAFHSNFCISVHNIVFWSKSLFAI